MHNLSRCRWLPVSVLLLAGVLSANAGELKLTLPQDGGSIANNMPSLGWAATGSDQTEVWIDGAKVATLPGTATRLVPFPLSFGAHRWKIVAITGSSRQESPESHFTVDDAPLGPLPENALLLRQNWWVQSSEVAGTNDATLSSSGVDVSGWAATSVPATVLTALVRNGVYPNPYVALNNTRIPDADDSFNQKNDLLKFSHLPGKNPWKNPYWYRTTFTVPATYADKRVWLTFNEINYRAEVWLNGKPVADPSEMVGMERTFRFDVTSLLHNQGENCLAVAIYPLDEPGEPAPVPVTPLADPGRNMGADAKISVNYTKWDTIGWDWQPEVRDRDMGITEDVFLSAGDDLEVSDLYAGSDLTLPDLSHADINLAFDLLSHSSVPQNGTVRATMFDGDKTVFTVQESFAVAPGQSGHFELTPANHPELLIRKPKLWWPAGLGEQHLYTLKVEARTQSDQTVQQTIHFGIRKVETGLSESSHTRYFRINGRQVFLQGGNWVIDMMLNWNASRYQDEMALARQANLNFLRIWGPTGVPPEALFDAADREGILLQQDFLNDWWGTEHNAPSNAPPTDLVEKATTAIIKKCRNHPSLILWCGGNEGPNPNEDLIKNRLLPELDPWGSRFYLPGSNREGVQGGGPYDNLSPEKYFNNRKLTGFNSEVGPSGVPEWESLQQFLTLPPTNWAEGRFPLDGQWAYHDATDRSGSSESRKFSHLDNVLRHRFGEPATTDLAGVRAYSARTQMLNFDTYRAAVEALNKNLWTKTTGFALWKFNSSWPSLVWQVTDWYMQCHAGFYAVRRACEPIHVQFNSDDRTVSVVNRTDESPAAMNLRAELFDYSMKSLWLHQETISTKPQTATAGSWTVPEEPGITFLKLRLNDVAGHSVSDNLYWLNATNNFSQLAQLDGAKVAAKVSFPGKNDAPVRVKLTNQGSAPALLVRVELVDRESRVEILPTLWSDNYVSLLPGESVELTGRITTANFPGHPALVVSGFNLAPVVY
jgi:Exo-beta-D-glucosaminidase Ig-fold domain/Glycosyl hydrolases family 2/Beta-galactosidase jelly roll domain